MFSQRKASRILITKQRSGASQDYVFSIRNGVTLAWVEPEDVPAVQAVKLACCGGREKPVFRPATDAEVTRWAKDLK